MNSNNLHSFHIPVMGTGHSIDSPIRIAHLGIDSVISIVDDLLVEKIRKHYCEQLGLPYKNIPRSTEDGRAKRITAYLDTVHQIVTDKFEDLKQQPFFQNTEKDRYFGLLPDSSPLKSAYNKLMSLAPGAEKEQLAEKLTNEMEPGSIDVNIMAKVDRLQYEGDQPMSSEYSDASAALRGFANSIVNSSVVLSAGFNPRLYSYISEFRDFYRDQFGELKKQIVLKVSDFRSALIQGKFLAKKGIEVSEFRIESGLNCGGHAFPSDGHLLPVLLKEFKEKKDQLSKAFQPLIEKFYESMDWELPQAYYEAEPKITVQGGIGTHGEMRRLLEDFEIDGTGWGTPFLVVPEATAVDDDTRKLMVDSEPEDLYLSNVSPLGVPFNNIRKSGAEEIRQQRIDKDKPGSPCPKGFLQFNTEFTEQPICTASNQYQLLKIDEINNSDLSSEKKEQQIDKVLDKFCLCSNLGHGALIDLGILRSEKGYPSICPSPNMAWFNREYSLNEMVDHIYGRSPSVVPEERPHMFAKELVMYVDYVEELMQQTDPDDKGAMNKLKKIRRNLEKGMELCSSIADGEAYTDENLESIKTAVFVQKERLNIMFSEVEVSVAN